MSQAKVVIADEDSVDSRVGGSRAAVTFSEAGPPGQLKTIKVQ